MNAASKITPQAADFHRVLRVTKQGRTVWRRAGNDLGIVRTFDRVVERAQRSYSVDVRWLDRQAGELVADVLTPTGQMAFQIVLQMEDTNVVAAF